jgi:hypothetical protein
MLLLSRIERVLGVPSSKADSRPAGLLLASLLLAGGFVWLAGSGHPLLAEVGEGTPGEVERKRSGDQEVDTAARAGGDGEKEREPGLAERATDRGERQVSPEEKREFAQQLREQKEHIRELIGDGQLDRARAAEEKLRKHVQEMEERLGNQPFPLQEHVLLRVRQIEQRLQEARQLGRLEEVERLERELEEVKRRARPGADPVRGRLAELQQRMMGAIKGGRPDEVVELGHQIADVLRGSRHDQPVRPDDGPFRPRPGAGRPDDRPREARPDGRRPVEGRRPDGPTPPGPARPRPDRPGPAISQELMDVVRQLREEVSQLRREVNELRGERGDERR